MFGLIFWQKRSLLILVKTFVSYFHLFLICIFILHFFFYFVFFFKVISIMMDEEMNELLYTFQNQFSSHTTQRESTWEDIVAMQAQTSMRLQAYNFKEVNFFNNNASYFFQRHNNIPSYYHSG